MIDIGELAVIGILIIVLFVGLVWLSLRIDRVEDKLEDIPTHVDLGAVEKQLESVAGRISALDERTKATTQMIASIHQHLLDGGNRNA